MGWLLRCKLSVLGTDGAFMDTYRTQRPLLVKATQCTQSGLAVTDLGTRHVRPGDWIIEGENHEKYVVDDAFFQRTFVLIPWEPVDEGRYYGC
jgi:hypothetical protein